MSKGLLKPEFNRVRTSTALQGNSMWENTIGIEQQTGTNAVIEQQIYAPGSAQAGVYISGGGGNNARSGMRAARQASAANLVSSSSMENTVKDQTALMALAKQQGIGSDIRGACKLCGGLGHLTKQCRNFLTGHTVASGTDVILLSGGSRHPPNTQPLVLLPEFGDLSDLSDISSSSSSGSEDSDQRRERRKTLKRKRLEEKKSKKDKKKSKKSRKEKKEKDDKRDR